MAAITICFDPKTKVYVYLSREDTPYTVASRSKQIVVATITQMFDGVVKADVTEANRVRQR